MPASAMPLAAAAAVCMASAAVRLPSGLPAAPAGADLAGLATPGGDAPAPLAPPAAAAGSTAAAWYVTPDTSSVFTCVRICACMARLPPARCARGSHPPG